MSVSSFSLTQIAIPAFGPSLLFGTGKGAILPVIALSARDLDASVALSGLIVGLIGIGSLFSNIPAALIIARYGERLSMIGAAAVRSEEHTSELQSLMRISYAVFCLKQKNKEDNELMCKC